MMLHLYMYEYQLVAAVVLVYPTGATAALSTYTCLLLLSVLLIYIYPTGATVVLHLLGWCYCSFISTHLLLWCCCVSTFTHLVLLLLYCTVHLGITWYCCLSKFSHLVMLELYVYPPDDAMAVHVPPPDADVVLQLPI
jgi:hypothetical protein